MIVAFDEAWMNGRAERIDDGFGPEGREHVHFPSHGDNPRSADRNGAGVVHGPLVIERQDVPIADNQIALVRALCRMSTASHHTPRPADRVRMLFILLLVARQSRHDQGRTAVASISISQSGSSSPAT